MLSTRDGEDNGRVLSAVNSEGKKAEEEEGDVHVQNATSRC